ncbi:MAG: UDP-N-acetylmuramate--L-alanine ligase [Marinilabiliales bacterium]|nr:MAG: UDP-N-acetylmuramate--L-alanine ligase [Marinilabiliales bacterium]
MNIHSLKNIYFLGIGGIGMSALARYFHAMGVAVSGYDKTPSDLTHSMENEGINIHYNADSSQIPTVCDLVIFTPAVPSDFEEWAEIEKRNIPFIKRSEALAMICNGKNSIAVAGTHGKTTVSAMTAHILATSGFPVNAFVGGIMSEYYTNVLINENADWVLVEADEYDRSFLRLHPDIAVVNAIDADHLDIYGSKTELELAFEEFMQQCMNPFSLILNAGIKTDIITLPNEAITFSASKKAVFTAENIHVDNSEFVFDVFKSGSLFIAGAHMSLPGRHNVENALASIAVADKLGLDPASVKNALASFRGVKRRLEKICECNGKAFYDDYAHHPKEISVLIDAIRELHPGKKVCGIFQPHLFTRTRDFAQGFAESLAMLDRVIITDIYPAREKPIEGIDAQFLLNKISGCEKEFMPYESLTEEVSRIKEDIILTIGAGDIDRLVPEIKEVLKNCR